MSDTRRNGRLVFDGPNIKGSLKVFWKLRHGTLAANGEWIADISFAPDYSISRQARNWIFEAASDDAIKLLLETDSNLAAKCVIHGMLDLADCGVIQVSSPALGSAKITFNFPTVRDSG